MQASCALTRARAGKLGEAEPLYRETLAARRETLGDRHPDTLTSISNMAVLLKAQGVPAQPAAHTHAGRACTTGGGARARVYAVATTRATTSSAYVRRTRMF